MDEPWESVSWEGNRGCALGPVSTGKTRALKYIRPGVRHHQAIISVSGSLAIWAFWSRAEAFSVFCRLRSGRREGRQSSGRFGRRWVAIAISATVGGVSARGERGASCFYESLRRFG